MTGIESVDLEIAIVHKVGNRARGEALQLSTHPLTLNDSLVKDLLAKYFLSPFNEQDQYHFDTRPDPSQSSVFSMVQKIFDDPARLTRQSTALAGLLYEKSTHVQVKEGELYVVLFNDVPLNGHPQKALGLFKSETKETFLKIFQHGAGWELTAEDGININKLDKGCLVFNTQADDGYIVLVADQTNRQQDTKYWMDDFLQVEPYPDDYHHTTAAIGLCKLFIENEYAEKFDIEKTDQIDMMNRSQDYFRNRQQFKMQEFAEEVIHHPEVVDSFMEYKRNFEANRNYTIDESFEIDGAALKKQSKMFKSVLKLDKNFHVYVHGRRDLIERGVDPETGRKFYKLFYEQEE